jgi:hypothetical protein
MVIVPSAAQKVSFGTQTGSTDFPPTGDSRIVRLASQITKADP